MNLWNRTAFLCAVAALAIPARARAAGNDVSVAYAGSLLAMMEKSVGPAFAASGFAYHGEAKGSTALANLIRDGLRTPDVFISADTAAIDRLRGADGHETARWYTTFAASRLQIAYLPHGKHAAAFASAAAGTTAWYDVLQQPDITVARTDPAQDPKGYRVLLALALAESFYRRPGLAAAVLGEARRASPILPEEDALARLDAGEVDAVWTYSTESVTRGLAAVELPPQINLGDPKEAATYAMATVTVGTKRYTGAPIVYALTIPTNAPNPAGGAAFVGFLFGPQGRALQKQAGLATIMHVVTGDRDAIPSALRSVVT